MTEILVVEPVRKSIEVELTPLEAFQLFTSDMASWWPATHHIGSTPFVEVIVEQRVGGGWYEVDRDGSTCQWGSILAWEPPRKVVFAWGLQSDWKFSPDLSRSSEVEVRFVPMGDSATLIEFEHRCLERHEVPAKLAESVNAGWSIVLGGFKALADKRSKSAG
ncbi:MAG TPA: SRPBCC family protein [Silvibacterium sp.]|nr:SRPBCC family protein [Silvibacterium sp.]